MEEPRFRDGTSKNPSSRVFKREIMNGKTTVSVDAEFFAAKLFQPVATLRSRRRAINATSGHQNPHGSGTLPTMRERLGEVL